MPSKHPASNIRHNRTYRRLRAAILASSNVCVICGEAIDMNLPARHPQSATIDHRIPLALGGRTDFENCAPAHWSCNSRKRDTVEQPRSRAW